MSERLDENREGLDKMRPKFEETEIRPGFFRYVFDKVVIEVDYRNPYFEGVPQIIFATYSDDLTQASLNRPDTGVGGVDMGYVVECIKEVARHTGNTKFWFEPYDKDSDLTSDEDRQIRRQARLRLFSRHVNMQEVPEGEGYIVDFSQ